jgi:hypothetical protein
MHLIRLWAVVSILALTGCGDAAESPYQPGDLSVQASQGTNPSAEFNQQLAQLRRAVARFHNFEAAAEAGYGTQLTVCLFYSGLGAQGYHYGNLALFDGTVELLEPEVLQYEPRSDGSLRLVALEYIVPVAAWMGVDPPSVLGQEFQDNGAGLYTPLSARKNPGFLTSVTTMKR